MNIKGKVDFLKTIKLSENFNETKLHIPSDSSSTVNLLNFKNEDDYGIYVDSTGISSRGNTLDFKARDYNNITIHDLLTLRPEGNVGIGTTNPTEYLSITGNNSGNITSLGLRNGNSSINFNDGAQISFGWNGLNQYKHFIHTRHNGPPSENNAIDFYLCDGTQNNTVTSGSIHTMSLVSGNVGIGTTNPQRKLDLNSDGKITFGDYVQADNKQGIYWYSGENYGIYRTSGGWDASNYQQLMIKWDTGIILDPGDGNYGKSHVGVVGGMSIGDSYYGTKYDNGLIVQGNMGVGTTNPSAKLDVSGELKIRGTNRHTHICYSDGNTYIRGSTNSGHVYLNDNGGNVGIGVTNPTYKLQVNGNTYSNLLYGLNIQNSNGIIGNTLTFNRNQLDISVGNVGYLHYMENNPTNGFGFTDNHKRSTNTYGRYIRFWIKGASNGHTIYLQGFANWYYNGNNQLKFMNGTTLTNSTSDCISNTYVEGNKGQRWMVTPWYDTNSVGGDGFRLGIKNIQGSTFYMTQVVLEFTKNSTGLS